MTDSPEKDPQEPIVAFLDLAAFDDGVVFRGGCLVTDVASRPLEFRVSGAIRPTKLQRMLYGDSLHGYICSDLVGLPIIETLETMPTLVLVRDAAFLAMRPSIDIPILCVQGAQGGEVVFEAHTEFLEDASEDSAALPVSMKALDLLEPFHRLQSGLEEAHSLKIGEA